jgi:hypothetical protein
MRAPLSRQLIYLRAKVVAESWKVDRNGVSLYFTFRSCHTFFTSHFGEWVKMKFRTVFIGFMGLLGLVTAAMSLLSPSTAVNEDNLGVTALSNLRAYAGAGFVMALFALYSLSRKHLQDTALTMLIISLTGWDIGQIISYVADGKPDSFTVGSIVVQALLIPVAWKALKSK